MSNFIGSYKYVIYFMLITLTVKESWSKSDDVICGNLHLIQQKGIIMSPSYPTPFREKVHCVWNILSPPQSNLKIHVNDFDIPEDPTCEDPPCCVSNYLELSFKRFCGNMSQSLNDIMVQNHSSIILHYEAAPYNRGRGFNLTYNIEKKLCINQYRCKDGTCLNLSKRCDGTAQCPDRSDEMACPGSSKCGNDEVLCSLSSNHCFKLENHCDGVFQCPHGEDEIGCYPECEFDIKCENDVHCYSPSQRCDGISNCIDNSDELMCPDELCLTFYNKRRCRNGRCLHARLWCNNNDDCGDNSDEESCLKNSMITVAIMGWLLGGLFLVLAVGCSLRIYSRRHASTQNCQLSLTPPSMTRLRMPHSLSLPALIDNEFFRREPPPMYSVAVGNAGLPSRINSRRPRLNRNRVSTRRSNHRHTVAVPVPKPPSENASNYSLTPSSEDSLISSSNVRISTTDDCEQLISA